MKTLDVIKVDVNEYGKKCKKCTFNKIKNFCVFLKCVKMERDDQEYTYFKLHFFTPVL